MNGDAELYTVSWEGKYYVSTIDSKYNDLMKMQNNFALNKSRNLNLFVVFRYSAISILALDSYGKVKIKLNIVETQTNWIG